MRRQTLIELKQSAMKSCNFRGHDMVPWTVLDNNPHRVYESICRECGRGVIVEAFPAPNSIEIGGEAVALSCND